MEKSIFRIVCSSVAAAVIVSSSVWADQLPLGFINADKEVTVVSATGSTKVRDVLPYFSGDNILTSDEGVAGISLDGAGGVYVGAASKAAIDHVDGKYILALDKGAIGFSFEEGVSFSVEAAGVSVEPVAVQSSVSGEVKISPEGDVSVVSENGSLQAHYGDGQILAINAGESYDLMGDTGGLVKVQVSGKPGVVVIQKVIPYLISIGVGASVISRIQKAASPN